MKSPKNAVILLLALATVGGAIVAWRQHRELIELRAAALNKDERADLQKRLWAAEKRAKELATQLAARRSPATEEPGTVASDADNPTPDGTGRRGRRGPGGPGGGGGFNNVMAMMERPEVQKLMAVQQKAQLDGRYAALFKNLNLSPEQLDKFKTLLVEKQTAMQDVMAAARSQGIDPREDPEGFRKMIADTQAEVDTGIKATLGDEGFAKYENYQQTLPQRNIVSQLQQSLSYTGAPLSDAQAEQLVQILAQTSPKNSGGGNSTAMGAEMNVTVAVAPDAAVGRGGGDRVPFIGIGGGFGGFGGGGGATITDQAITLAQGVLSAPQVQGLQQIQQQQQAQQQLQQTIRQTMGGGRNGAGNTTTTAPSTAPAKKG